MGERVILGRGFRMNYLLSFVVLCFLLSGCAAMGIQVGKSDNSESFKADQVPQVTETRSQRRSRKARNVRSFIQIRKGFILRICAPGPVLDPGRYRFYNLHGFSKAIAKRKRIWWRRASWVGPSRAERGIAGHPWATRQSPLQPVLPFYVTLRSYPLQV